MLNESDDKNLIFYPILNKYFLSDWYNYPIKGYDEYSEYNLTFNLDKISKKVYDCHKFIKSNNFSKAWELIEQLDNTNHQLGVYDFSFDIELMRSAFFNAKRNFTEALENLRKIEHSLMALELLPSFHYVIRKVVFLRFIATNLFELNQFEESKNYIDKGIEVSEQYCFQHRSFDFYMLKGNIFQTSGQFTELSSILSKGLEIASSLNDQQKMIICYTNLGITESFLGNYDKSLDYHKKSLEIARETDSARLSQVLNNLGILYIKLGYLDDALSLLQEIEQKHSTVLDMRWFASIYDNIALIYITKGKNELAFDYIQKVLEIASETNYTSEIPFVFSHLAELYYRQGKLDKSEDFHLKTIEASKISRNMDSIIFSYTNLIFINLKLENTEKIDLYLNDLALILQNNSNEIYNTKYDLLSTMALLLSNDELKNENAIKKLKQLIDSPFLEADTSMFVYLQYCKAIFKLKALFGKELDWNQIEYYFGVLEE